MRAIVTGAEGFLGRHITRELEQAGHAVTGIDRSDCNLLADHAVDYVRRLCLLKRADYVIHLAAKVGRLFGEVDPLRTVMDNVGMTIQVAKGARAGGARLAYASTSEVYGDLGETVAVEDGPMRLPHNAYGLSKRHGEEFAALYCPERIVCLRFSMPYGPGHPPGRGRAALTNFLWQALRRQPIPVHIGAERSWCYVGDTARAARMILEAADRDGAYAGAWNVGRDDTQVALRTVAEMACDMTGADRALIQDVPAPAAQTVVKRLSTRRLFELGWRPTVELEEGMAAVLNELRALPDHAAAKVAP
jgi:UDP-glucuronate 4-epimerase